MLKKKMAEIGLARMVVNDCSFLDIMWNMFCKKTKRINKGEEKKCFQENKFLNFQFEKSR